MIKTTNTTTKDFFELAGKELVLSEDRKELLLSIAEKIIDELEDRDKINLNFICTHNSRRSQLAQVWSFYASFYFGLDSIFSFSGGTEVTAFHRNTVKCLQKNGFEFNVDDFSHQNPRYLISFYGSKKSILGFSKTYDDSNNAYPYIAITTCDSADQNCPFIPDAIERFHLPYVDPKTSDNTENQNEKYLETSKQIAGEIFFIFREVAENLD
jgi:arsenate reductase